MGVSGEMGVSGGNEGWWEEMGVSGEMGISRQWGLVGEIGINRRKWELEGGNVS